MANIGTLMVTIDGNTYKLQRELKKAEMQMKRFSGRATSRLGKLGTAIKGVKTQLLAVGGIAAGALIGLGIRKSIQEWVKFEDALLDLQKVMSETEGNALQFKGTVEELSQTFGESAAEVLQGAANFKQAGFAVKEAFELQEVALRSATVSNLDVVESSRMIVRILKGFKAPASEAAKVLDIMNEVSNKFATNLGELATGMANLSPVANLMGFTFEETAAVLTPIIEVFGSGSEAAVALRTSLLRLVSDQSKVKDTLRKLGVAQKDVNGKLRSGKDILFDVAKKFQTLDKNQKVFTAGQLVGIRQAAKAVEVFDGLTKVQDVHAVALDSSNSALKEQEIRLASAGKQLDRLKQSFNNIAREIGIAFTPLIIEVLTLLNSLAKAAIAPLRFDLGDLAKDVRGFLGMAKESVEEIAAIRAQVLPSADKLTKRPVSKGYEAYTPAAGSVEDWLKKNKDAPISMAEVYKAQEQLSMSAENQAKTFIELSQGIDKAAEARAQDLYIMQTQDRVLGKLRTSLEDLPVERVPNMMMEMLEISKLKGIEKFERTGLLEDLIREADVFAVEEALKRVETAYEQLGLKTDRELRKVGENLVKNFQTIEQEGGLSAERIGVVWKSTAEQIDPTVLSAKTREIFDNLEEQYNKSTSKIKKKLVDFNAERIKLTKSATAVAIAQLLEEAKAYDELVEKGKISAEELRDFKTESVRKITLEHSRAYQTMQSSIMSWGDEFGNTLTDMVMGAEVSFSDILNSFTRMIADMAIKITIIQPMMQALFGQAAGGSGSGIVGALAGAVGTWIGGNVGTPTTTTPQSAYGGTFNPQGFPTTAEGGIVTKPTARIFGEAGPEAIIPLDRMSQVMGSIGGGGSNVEINIIGAPEGTRVEESESEQGGRSIDVILDEKMSQQVKPGSKFNNQMLSQFRDMQQSTIRR